MKIVALDASLTSTGWASYDDDWDSDSRINYGTLSPGKLRGAERLAWIRGQVKEMTEGADLVVLEGYAYARANQAHQIGELGGVLRLLFHDEGIPLALVAPMKRAKYATGRGNAKKEEVLVSAVRRLGYAGASNDEADALWLLEMALDHYLIMPTRVPLSGAIPALQGVEWPDLS